MDDPGHRMGWLDGQSLRAARVVIDIGVHCGFDAPEEVGGGGWTYDKAWQFLTNHANQEAWLRFELNRYLGWPGQAPFVQDRRAALAQLREEARERENGAFDLKTFHRKALDLGAVPLDTLGRRSSESCSRRVREPAERPRSSFGQPLSPEQRGPADRIGGCRSR